MSDMISKEEAKKQVNLMAKRTAALYEAFTDVLVEEFGKDKAKELTLKAVYRYGEASGENVRQGVQELGLGLTPENYSKIPDLPTVAWEMSSESEEDQLTINVSYCPLAEYWLKGKDTEMARLYCYVDQAKFSAYNPELECLHTHNMLDGDDICTLVIRKKVDEKGES